MKVVLWGSTGQAIVLGELFIKLGDSVVALFDNDSNARSPFDDVPIFHGELGFTRWALESDVSSIFALAAVGGARGRDRLAIHARFRAAGLRITNAVHPAAYVAYDATLGCGVQIMASATVGARAIVGDACIVNTSAIVDHECHLEEGVHVGPGATLAGCVRVGSGAFVGAGAVVLPRVRIGIDAVVGAGAVVTRDVANGVTVVGNPARVIRAIDLM